MEESRADGAARLNVPCRWKRMIPAVLSLVVSPLVATAAVPSGPAVAASARQVLVSTMTIGSHGKVLVSGGKALYTLNPSTTACGVQCLKIWPALTLPHLARGATAGRGVSRTTLGVMKGPGGIRQVTYRGHALYWYSGDGRAQVNGDFTDAWGKWTAVVVDKSVAHGGKGPTTGSSTAGSGGASF